MVGVKQARDGAVRSLTLDQPASLNAMRPDLLGAAILRSPITRASASKKREWPGQARP